MAKFQYRMQNILNIKMKLEVQAKNAYGIANGKYQEEQKKLQTLMLRRMEYEQKLKELVNGAIDVQKIAHARNDVNAMKTLVRRQMIEVHKAELEVERTRQELNSIVLERKTHEKLRERAFEQFKKELAEQESKEIDELVSYTYNKG